MLQLILTIKYPLSTWVCAYLLLLMSYLLLER